MCERCYVINRHIYCAHLVQHGALLIITATAPENICASPFKRVSGVGRLETFSLRVKKKKHLHNKCTFCSLVLVMVFFSG